MFYLFKDFVTEEVALFDNMDDLNTFINKLNLYNIEHNFPIQEPNTDYTITMVPMNETFEEWLRRI